MNPIPWELCFELVSGGLFLVKGCQKLQAKPPGAALVVDCAQTGQIWPDARCQLACCPSLFLEGKTWYIGKTLATPYQLKRGKPPEDSVFLDDLTCNTIGYFCGSKYMGLPLPLPPKLVDEYLNQPIHVGCGHIVYCDTCDPTLSHLSLLCHPQR